MEWLLGFSIPPVNIPVYFWWIDFRNASCPFTLSEMATPWYSMFLSITFHFALSCDPKIHISTICNYVHYLHRTFIMRFKYIYRGYNIQRHACHCTTFRSSVLLRPYLETAPDSWFHIFILHLMLLYLQANPSIWYYDINIRRTTLVHMGRSELARLSDRTTADGRSELYGSLVSQYTICQ